MSDTAAFFAKKKGKKKAFKFNANLVDADTVTNTVHVDAPALSTDQENPITAATPATTVESEPVEWDDEALTPAPATAIASTAAAIGDLVTDHFNTSTEQGDLQEKLRVEETKAQLAAARLGMEEAAKKKKEEEKPAPVARFATANTKWVPRHMRSSGGGMRTMTPGGKLDTANQELFPDLAAADKILEQKKDATLYKPPKKTPVGGGATWATKKPKKQPTVAEFKAEQMKGAASTETNKDEPELGTKATETPATSAIVPEQAPAEKKVPTKKKKKRDVSTFKPGGA